MFFSAMQAVKKLETALQLDDSKPETLWCLGNAYTSEARSLSCLRANGLACLTQTFQALIDCIHYHQHMFAFHVSDWDVIFQGFLVASPQTAKDFFKKASNCFEKASELVGCSTHNAGYFAFCLWI